MSFFCWTQRKIFWRKFVTRLFWGTVDFHSRKKNTMEVNGAPELLRLPHSSEYLPFCSAEQRHSNRFGTTWGWVNDFWVNDPFKVTLKVIMALKYTQNIEWFQAKNMIMLIKCVILDNRLLPDNFLSMKMQWVLLVMAKHFKHDWLGLYVLDKGLGHLHWDLDVKTR